WPLAVGQEHVDVAATLAVDARMIGQQPEALASDQVGRVADEHLDAGTHLCSRRRGRGAGDRNQQPHEMMRAHKLLVVALVAGCAGGAARTAGPAPASADPILASLST